MSDERSKEADSTILTALSESMQVVQRALEEPPGLSNHQIVDRISEWVEQLDELERLCAQRSDDEQPTESADTGEIKALYDIVGALNSSLDLTETLNSSLDAIVQLKGAERGCLMLLDEDGKLKVRAVRNFERADPDSADLALSHTVVREAIERQEPVLTTNAQHDPRFSAQESVVGYQLRSIVCVPLHVRDRVIGALYLDNRIRKGAFSEQDLPMLEMFADQAAIAIENARLYTMTDQALNERVEELTSLQQIDRELNESLDLDRVSDLTLSWALRRTGAAAGALTVWEDGVPRVVAERGEPAPGVPTSEVVQAAKGHRDPFFAGDRLLVPIWVEERLIGLLDLRGRQGRFQSDQVEFAGRLADHAAIAIQNARLYEKVQEASEAKSEFVSFVAHELRTPMTSIRGYADMLRKGMFGELTGQQRRFLDTICNNVERMRVLVSDLQDISRIEARKLPLEIQRASIQEAVEKSVQMVESRLEEKEQEIQVDVPADLPPVRADPSRLTQILVNLLSNANKYTPEGGRVAIRAQVEDGFIRCAVSDTGIGMSDADMERLFTKFFRSEEQEVQDQPGTGLGLCIVKSLVELQGGSIEVESALGEGTTVTFTVPVSQG